MSNPSKQIHLSTFIKGITMSASMVVTSAFAAQTGAYNLMIGTYTDAGSDGIYVYRFNSKDGSVKPVSSAKTENPSYLIATRDGHTVYAVNELPGDNDSAAQRGGISAFHFDAKTGGLSFLNRVSAEGNDPCHLSLSPDGKYLVTANYSVAANPGGSFTAFPLKANGEVGTAVQTVQTQGAGPVKARQASPHAHSAVFSPDGHYLFVQDLGADKSFAYHYDPAAKQPFSPANIAEIPAKAGSGPRHLTFSQNGHFAYATNELDATVSVFAYQHGTLKLIETQGLSAADFKGEVGAGAIHLSPDGRFLYATNRGEANQMVIFAVDAKTGRLTLVDRQSTLGKTPREFVIDPSGRWLIVGNQNSDSVYVFKRDVKTGKLAADPQKLSVSKPSDIKLIPAV